MTRPVAKIEVLVPVLDRVQMDSIQYSIERAVANHVDLFTIQSEILPPSQGDENDKSPN